MKKKFIRLGVTFLSTAVVIAGALAISCGNKSTNPPEPASVSTLADIHNANATLSGWTEDASAYEFLPDTQTFSKLYDGDISRYIFNNEFYPAFRSILYDTVINGADTVLRELEFHVIIDDGTPAIATAFYNKMTTLSAEFDLSVKYEIPGFNPSIAIGNESGGGITVWAHFKQFYFKFILSGYSETALAATDAAAVLTKFKSAIK
jgi:hypothetical protein